VSEDHYRRNAEALLRRAAEATNMAERGRLIDEAMQWHNRAIDAHESPWPPLADDESGAQA